MPEISLSLSGEVYKELESRAKKKEWSTPDFAETIICEYINGWSQGYFERIIGSMKDDPLEVPEELPWSLDCKRNFHLLDLE